MTWVIVAAYLLVGYHIAQARYKVGHKNGSINTTDMLESCLFFGTSIFDFGKDLGKDQRNPRKEKKFCDEDSWVTMTERWKYVSVFTLWWLPNYALVMLACNAVFLFSVVVGIFFGVWRVVRGVAAGLFSGLFRA